MLDSGDRARGVAVVKGGAVCGGAWCFSGLGNSGAFRRLFLGRSVHPVLMSSAALVAVVCVVVAVVLAVARDLENARRRRVRRLGDHGSAFAGQKTGEEP
ncbi:hypothetical protein [Streptomyces sp. NPDC059788]|uniref:hypothetical protein n=1 Tax=Streptomyces sp. NPDC059788 TaxID=3346948 RepID=UPI003649D6F0